MKIAVNVLIGVLLIVGYGILDHLVFSPKIAYVDSGKLMVGFSEAAKVEREIKAEDDKWQGQLKAIQDSLQVIIAAMTKEYDNASAAKKKEMQDMLTARNQQMNNFRQANIRKIEELKQKKMQSVIEKANLFLMEYGKKHRYGIIFGTAAGGSILYGNENVYDITSDIIKGLNERYK